MAYAPQYTADDTSAVVIDAGTKFIITLGSFAAIFALVFVIVILVRMWKKR